MADFYLVDDGTLDTVVECEECAAQLRYSFESWDEGALDDDDADDYDAFIDWCLEDASNDHECEPCDECDCADPTAPYGLADECDCDCGHPTIKTPDDLMRAVFGKLL